MSRGYVFQPTYTVENEDGEREQRTSSIWWVGFSVDGDQKRESAKTKNKAEAQKFLTKRLREADVLGPDREDVRNTTFEDVAALIRADYKHNEYDEDILERRLAHLEEYFGGRRVIRFKPDGLVSGYVEYRQDEGASNATINRELACLRRCLKLAVKGGRALESKLPDVASSMLEENNVRKGFWTEEEFQKLKEELPPRLRPFVEFAFVTGWRRSELLSRNWEHVDLEHGKGSIRLEPGESKSGEGREFPFNSRLRAVVDRQLERKRETEEKHGCEVEALFFYYEPSKNGLPAGRRIKSFRRAWATAVEAVGHPERIPHDFRRSAARRLLRAGVPEKVIMKLCGWESRHVFDRYSILNRQDLQDAVESLPDG